MESHRHPLVVLSRTQAAAVIAATLLTRVAGSESIHVSCTDGGTGVMRGFGRHTKAPEVCDIDHACDGICTFALNPPCERCTLRPPRYLCHEPGQCSDTGPPCASEKARVALSLRAGRSAKTVWPNRRHPRCVLRCLPARSCGSTTTTMPPDGEPNLIGFWTITESSASDSCPAGVGRRLDHPADAPLGIVQDGRRIAACALPLISFSIGTLSAGSFTLDSGECCGVLADDGSYYDYSQKVIGAAPDSSGVVPIHIQWKMVRKGNSGPSGDPATCERVVSGTLTPLSPTCATHSDCIQVDPCGRCVEGRCRFDPLCR